MLTIHDIDALTELLMRTPMTKAEQIFAGRLIDILVKMIPPQEVGPPVEESQTPPDG